MSAPTPRDTARERTAALERRTTLDMLAVIAQTLLAVVAGGAAGHFADPGSPALVIGAFGLFAGLVAGYLVSNGVLLLFVPVALAAAARRVARGEPVLGTDPRDDEGFAFRVAVRAVNATLYASAFACATAVSLTSERTGFFRAWLAFAVAAFLVGRLSRRARRAVA